MASLYLLRGGPFYKSHEFAMLFIRHLLDILMNANIVEASFIRSKNGNVAIYTPTTNYSCRLDSLEHLSFYEFTSTYKKIASIKQLLFKEPHPQQASHSLKVQTFKHIINVWWNSIAGYITRGFGIWKMHVLFLDSIYIAQTLLLPQWPLRWSYFIRTLFQSHNLSQP